jgi:hypothetical protein
MNIAILLCGHVRFAMNNDKLKKMIDAISKKGNCDIYGYIPENKEHSTITWYQTSKQLQQQTVTLEELKAFLNFKKVYLYKEIFFSQQEKEKKWGKSPISYVGIRSIYTSINSCLELLEKKYDIIIRMRPDYYKFDYANYTEDIINTFSTFKYDGDSLVCLKVRQERGEDSFFFSNQQNFTNVVKYIINNFEDIEQYAKTMNYYFMPEDIIGYACKKQKINQIII